MPLFAKLSIIIADVFLSDGDQGLGLNRNESICIVRASYSVSHPSNGSRIHECNS